jgi:hypothetical protein
MFHLNFITIMETSNANFNVQATATSNAECKANIIGIRSINGGKLHLTIAERKGSLTALGLFNADDDRFSSNQRLAWLTASPTQAKTLLPALSASIDKAVAGGVGTVVEFKDNPVPAIDIHGNHLRVQITEGFEPLDDWQKANIAKAVKQKPHKDGNTVLLSGGKPIFSKTDVVLLENGVGEVNDQRIKHDGEMPLNVFVDQLAGASVVAEQVS